MCQKHYVWGGEAKKVVSFFGSGHTKSNLLHLQGKGKPSKYLNYGIPNMLLIFDKLPRVKDTFVSKNFEEIVSLVKFSNNISWKISSQRRFLEFLQNSSEFVVATVLRNPIGNLISLAEFHIFVEFPPKTILGSSIMYKFHWKRDSLYWILGTVLKIEAVGHSSWSYSMHGGNLAVTLITAENFVWWYFV